MKFVKEYWFIIAFIATPVATGLVWIVSLDSRLFDSPEQKVKHEIHVNTAPSLIEQKTRSIFDSIETVKTNEMLEVLINDSKSVKKHIHHLDSINLLTADQIYQLNQRDKITPNE